MAIELSYGESFIATFKFSYTGLAMPIGLKVALGRIYVATFDEVEAWVLKGSVESSTYWKSYTKEIRCTIPSEGATALKPGEDYDSSAEIGDYPWTGKVYIRKQQADIIRVTPPTGFKELAVSYKKA